MPQTKLMLKFTTPGSRNPKVKAAARIRVDGSGTVRVTDAETGAVEFVSLNGISGMSIQAVSAGLGNVPRLTVPVFAA